MQNNGMVLTTKPIEVVLTNVADPSIKTIQYFDSIDTISISVPVTGEYTVRVRNLLTSSGGGGGCGKDS